MNSLELEPSSFVSSAVPQAACRQVVAAQRALPGGSGEERHLTRSGEAHARGCWGGVVFYTPPTALRRAKEFSFSNPPLLIAGIRFSL